MTDQQRHTAVTALSALLIEWTDDRSPHPSATITEIDRKAA